MLWTATRCLSSQSGSNSIEYTLIGALISIAIVAGLSVLGPTLNAAFFTGVATTISTAAP